MNTKFPYKSVDRIIKELDDSRNNKVNIEWYKEQMEKALENIEKLKDAHREITYEKWEWELMTQKQWLHY